MNEIVEYDDPSLTSPWPAFVAIGFASSEIGLIFEFVALSVGGLLLFAVSVAGILYEIGYGHRPWLLVMQIAVVYVAVGGVIWILSIGNSFGIVLNDRGITLGVSGVVLCAASIILDCLEADEIFV